MPLEVPFTWGVLSVAGESGSVSVIWGGAGAWVSTMKLREAGVWSVFWAWSVALTWKV